MHPWGTWRSIWFLRHTIASAQVKSLALRELAKPGPALNPSAVERGMGWPAAFAGWMYLNNINLELMQFNQLQGQSAANVWRLNAFRQV